MNKRLAMLEQLTQSGKADSFAWYALALEYKKEGRFDEALRTFETLRANDPDYLAMYLMAGQLLIEMERREEARSWLEQGTVVARAKNDLKALSELQGALEGGS
jgi:predicted Zn-dependent protease